MIFNNIAQNSVTTNFRLSLTLLSFHFLYFWLLCSVYIFYGHRLDLEYQYGRLD